MSVYIDHFIYAFRSFCWLLFFECYGDHRDLHVLTHSFPTRRSSDLSPHRNAPTAMPPVSADECRAIARPATQRGADNCTATENSDTSSIDRKSTRLNSSH